MQRLQQLRLASAFASWVAYSQHRARKAASSTAARSHHARHSLQACYLLWRSRATEQSAAAAVLHTALTHWSASCLARALLTWQEAAKFMAASPSDHFR